MRHLRWVFVLALAAVLGAMAWWSYAALVDRAVMREAGDRAMNWAEHAAVRLDRIEALAGGATATPEDWRAIGEMARFGDVFRFKVFSPGGVLRFVSDDPEAQGTSLGEHNSEAAAVLRTGKPSNELADGRANPDRPDLYSETYLPVRRDGRVVAIAEVYLDQSGTLAAIRAEYALFGIIISTLTVLAFAGPGIVLMAVLRRLRARNAELDAERVRALAADRAKSEFLTTVSHELRTPMNGVIGVAQILETTALDEDQSELVEILKRSAEGQMNLIEDLLSFGEIEAGALRLSEDRVDPSGLLEEALGTLRAAAARKNIALHCVVAKDMPVITTDLQRLRQVVINLAGNAVKFTDEGSVRVTAYIERPGEDVTRLRVEVSDTGPGIEPDQHERIFERFTQADGSIRRQKGGTGLGLAISRAIVSEMGGTLTVRSHPGQGSSFTLCIPVRFAADTVSATSLEAAA